jgi:hypothetical protein
MVEEMVGPGDQEPRDRSPWHLAPGLAPFVGVGVVAIVAGGLVAAVSRPTGWSDGPWVAAYLVLVAGVGQVGLGAGQAMYAGSPCSRRRVRAQLALLNGSSLLVVGGTLAAAPALVTVGSALLLGALVSFARATGGRGGGRRAWLYLALLAVLIGSIPIGTALAWIRA